MQGSRNDYDMTVHCALTDFDEAVLINRPVSPLLLLTVKTQARWWERTAVSRDERKLQEERKGGGIIEMPYMYVHHITCVRGRRGRRQREKEGGKTKGWEKEVERQGQAYILTILFPLCPAPQ